MEITDSKRALGQALPDSISASLLLGLYLDKKCYYFGIVVQMTFLSGESPRQLETVLVLIVLDYI